MKKTLTVVCTILAISIVLGWYFLVPPLYFDVAGKLKTVKNNSYVTYRPRYHMHWTGMSIRSDNFKQDNQYLFCWFWSGYGIKSMQIYSNAGNLLYDKSYETRKDVVNTSSFKVYFDAEQDWLHRDTSVYLKLSQVNDFRVVLVDYLGNQFEDTVKAPAAR